MKYDDQNQTYYPEVIRNCLICHPGKDHTDTHHLLVQQGLFVCTDCHPIKYDSQSQTYYPEIIWDCTECHTTVLQWNATSDPTPTPTPTPTPPVSPTITTFSPISPVIDNAGDTREFDITTDQIVNITWFIEDAQVQFNESVTDASYTNTSAILGIWNVSAVASNINGTVKYTWTWNVTTIVPVPPVITFYAPYSPTNDTAGTSRKFGITVDQIANITWFINGIQVQSNESVMGASYTNTSSSPGVWDVVINATNANGSTSYSWIWNVVSQPVYAPSIISWSNNKTNNDSLILAVNTSESVNFNATANQTITSWNWYLNDVSQSNNYDNFIASWDTAGTETVQVNATNSNGTSNAITWTVTVKAQPVMYIPPTPTNINSTTGSFWVNTTWQAGTGNATDSYNLSVNNVWTNGTASTSVNSSSLPAHAWQNVTVYAYNASGGGSLSTSPAIKNTQIPDNPPVQSPIGSKSVDEGQWLNFTVKATDADNDLMTYGTNATKGSFNTTTGNFSWLITYSDAGVYTWYFNSSDGYGGVTTETVTVNVNNIPLSITSFSLPSDPTTTQSTAQTFSVTLNRTANVTWYMNGTKVHTDTGITSSSYTNSTAETDTWNVTASATDNIDTVSRTWNWNVVPESKPTTAVDPPDGQNSWYKTNTVYLNVTDSDGIKYTNYSVDGGISWNSNPGSGLTLKTPVVLSDGNHSIQYYSVDTLGNTESTKTQEVKIDTTSPDINIGGVVDNSYYNKSITPVIAITDTNPNTQSITLNGTPYTSGTVISEEGKYTLVASATDKAGNSDSKTINFTIDKTPPSITASATTSGNPYTSGAWTNQDVTVSFTCSDALSGIASCSSPTTLSGEGANQEATGYATDQAGNSASAAFSGISIDKTAPTITINSPVNGNIYVLNQNLVADWSVSDAASGISTATGTYPNGSIIDTTSAGTKNFVVNATDNAGNIYTKNVTYYIHSDSKPVTAVDPPDGQNGWYKTNTVYLNVTDPDGIKYTNYSVDGGIWNSNPGSGLTLKTPVVLSDGNHSIQYYSVDTLGNTESTKTQEVKIDTTSPDINIQGVVDNSYYNNDVIPAITITDTNPNIQSITLNGAPYTSGTAISAEGSYMLMASATDKAGNHNSKTLSFTIDKTLPSITISGVIDNSYYNKSITPIIAITDTNPNTQSITLNGTPYTSGTVISEEGRYTLVASATDKAGNSDSKTINFTIDKTSPTITGAATISPNANGWYNDSVVIHFTADDVLSGINSVTPDITLSTEGANQSATGTAIDKAGNSASFTVSGINIDKTAPTITINSPVNGNIYVLDQNLVTYWLVSDATSGIATAMGTYPSGSVIDTASVGTKTFSVYAADNAGNTNIKNVTYYIGYNYSEILPPIKPDESSIFKLGSTVPVKFQLWDASGNFVTDAVARFYISKVSTTVTGTILEPYIIETETTGNLFVYDPASNLYQYNLGTKSLSTGTWQIRIDIDDGSSKTVIISLKK
ncbi:MAG: PxKF domain-containing protein [Candidatus Methanoperedens sp.]|nr:PxKF domain-containing protein [Candidatus Methanoperedens nitroreducens]MDJ1422443.1 PxKF domain-containing protein [Candidatus Methanoperedens sp.]